MIALRSSGTAFRIDTDAQSLFQHLNNKRVKWHSFYPFKAFVCEASIKQLVCKAPKTSKLLCKALKRNLLCKSSKEKQAFVQSCKMGELLCKASGVQRNRTSGNKLKTLRRGWQFVASRRLDGLCRPLLPTMASSLQMQVCAGV